MPTFAHAHDGAFTGFNNATPTWRIHVAMCQLSQAFVVFDTTASGDGVAARRTASKRYAFPFEGRGWYEATADAGSTYTKIHVTANSSTLSGSLYARNSSAVIVREIDIEDVTAAEDAIPLKEFDNSGEQLYYGSLRSYLLSGASPQDNDHNASPATLLLPLGVGSVQATSIVEESSSDADFRKSGPVQVNYRFSLDGAITNTGTPFTETQFNGSLNLDNGQTATGVCLLSNLRMDLDYRTGGPVPVQFKGIFQSTVTFT